MIYCYPTIGKQKSVDVCAAFAHGCGGQVVTDCLPRDGPAMFFGINATNEAVWQEIRRERRDFYFADNSYFDQTRQTYFRVSKNRLQHPGTGTSDCARFRALGIEIKPWRDAGKNVLVCPQSDHFMRKVVGYPGDWLFGVLQALKHLPVAIKVREWQRDKGKLAASLARDLEDALALVTWSSAAAVTACLSGVPIIVGTDSAALPMAGRLELIGLLPKAPTEQREQWAGVLADNQWSIAELAAGDAWRALQ